MTGSTDPAPVDFVLASASPARLQTLRSAGLSPRVIVSRADEELLPGETPAETALRLAVIKAQVVARSLGGAGSHTLVVGCDSVLEFDGVAYGKPGDAAEARLRWQAMRGRSGLLHTGHCLIRLSPEPVVLSAIRTTVVNFAYVSDDEIDTYISTGEPLAVAGAFTLDGLGAAFVSSIEGDPSNVVGISLPLLRTLVTDVGLAWTNLWTRKTATPPKNP